MGCRVEPTYVMFGVAFPSQAFFEIRWVNKYGSNGESSRCQQVPLKSLRRLNQSTIDVLVIDIDSYMWIEHPFPLPEVLLLELDDESPLLFFQAVVD